MLNEEQLIKKLNREIYQLERDIYKVENNVTMNVLQYAIDARKDRLKEIKGN